MVDHHVDRPGVEAPRGVKLTGTNRSIGLIVLIKAHERDDLLLDFDVFSSAFGDRPTVIAAGCAEQTHPFR